MLVAYGLVIFASNLALGDSHYKESYSANQAEFETNLFELDIINQSSVRFA